MHFNKVKTAKFFFFFFNNLLSIMIKDGEVLCYFFLSHFLKNAKQRKRSALIPKGWLGPCWEREWDLNCEGLC